MTELPKYKVQWLGDWSRHPMGPKPPATHTQTPGKRRYVRKTDRPVGAGMTARNREIVRRVLAGERQSDVAEEYNLSRQRVHELVKKHREGQG